MTIDTTPDLEPASSTHASGSVFTSKSRLRAFFEAWPPLVLIALFLGRGDRCRGCWRKVDSALRLHGA
jgi:hypothetical protein